MKIIYYDCFSGISGDMNLGVMVDLGVDPQYLINELSKLNLNEYTLSFKQDQRKGITGTRAIVELQSHNHHETPSSVASQNELKIGKGQSFMVSAPHHHEHGRNFGEIKEIILNSTLSENVKKLSIDIFNKVAVAEAKIHGKSVDDVHFHEVGALDSIVDIIGAAICIDFLKPDKIMCSTIELGGGTVRCEHGTFPVPAPATAEILKGIPVKMGAVNVETTTPTGAAILATLVDDFTDKQQFTISKIAYGIGFRDTAIPNVLRAYLAETSDSEGDGFINSVANVIECNIDDMNPEMYEYVMNRLFEAGADDVYFQPSIMKKSRPATILSVICDKTKAEIIENIILTETSTLGLRKYEVIKKMLHREWESVQTKWGTVRIKHAIYKGQRIKSKPEYNDCLIIAETNKIPIADVYKEITRIISS